MKKISVFGLGYVGAVTSACLAQKGFEVIGVEPNKVKVDIVNSGHSPIIEKDLAEYISRGVSAGRIKCTSDFQEAIANTEVSFICVGTPSRSNGSIDLRYIENVCTNIGTALREKDEYHLVVVRSTVLPGTTLNVIGPLLEEVSGKKINQGFGLAFNPEFLRESTAIYDFFHPPKTVVGSGSQKNAETIANIYRGIEGPFINTTIETAEMVKYADNLFHALKVCFANEFGNICKQLNVDSHEVMNIFCQDRKLNLSPYYLKPGFAFGGSCLPKDLKALTYLANRKDLNTPILNAIMPSNEQQIKYGINQIVSLGKKNIGILGFAFKAGTDDLRESPIVELIETLLGKGYRIKIYDQKVSLAKLFGANKAFIQQRIPHISELMVEDINDIVEHSQVIVIGNKSDEFINIFPQLTEEQYVIDLVRISETISTKAVYDGICW